MPDCWNYVNRPLAQKKLVVFNLSFLFGALPSIGLLMFLPCFSACHEETFHIQALLMTHHLYNTLKITFFDILRNNLVLKYEGEGSPLGFLPDGGKEEGNVFF